MDEQKRLRSLLQNGVGKNKSILVRELDRNVKQMKMSSDQMEKENLNMEKKLTSLKERLRSEREEQGRMVGPRWKSSQQLMRKPEKKKKTKGVIKVLKDQPLDTYKHTVKSSTQPSIFCLCGQCENRKAKVECNECTELYCSLCYKQFHSKGALRKHTWKSLEQSNVKTSPTDSVKSHRRPSSRESEKKGPDDLHIVVSGKPAPTTPKPPPLTSNRISPVKRTSPGLSTKKTSGIALDDQELQAIDKWKSDCFAATRSNHEQVPKLSPKQTPLSFRSEEAPEAKIVHKMNFTNNSLLDGTFDEDANAAAFQEALNEWRERGSATTPRNGIAPSTRSTSVGTDKASTNNSQLEVNFKFGSTSSLSYMDRLIMKRHKQNAESYAQLMERGDLFTTPLMSSDIQFPSESEQGSARQNPPSPRILSVHYLPPAQFHPDSMDISISSCDDYTVGVDGLESDAVPIVTPSVSDDISLNDVNKNSDVANVVELNFEDDSIASGFSKSISPKIKRDEKVPVHQQNSIKKEEQRSLDRKYVDVLWRPPAKHQNMDDYFLLGISRTKRDHVEESSKQGNLYENHSDLLITGGSVWNRKYSFTPVRRECFDETQNPEENDATKNERRYSYTSLPVLKVGEYDFVDAQPPPSKGDNYDKVHRASTSFSISTHPFDPWAESDFSAPNSRRSSNLDVSSSQVRKVSTDFDDQPIDEFEKGTNNGKVNFEAIDFLAENISAMYYYDEEGSSIEDNDEGSGLTSPDSLSNEL